MSSEAWKDGIAAAKAVSDQRMAAVRDLEAPYRTFMAACTLFEAELAEAGIERNSRITALVTLALGTGLTSE